MGTDIHLIVEQKRKGVWHRVKPHRCVMPEWIQKQAAEGMEWSKHDMVNSWYKCRNYNTFAILADVRNGHGFAGCITGEGFNPISEPKGLPDDYIQIEEYELGDHSFSWLTVKELMDYDWTQTTSLCGVVDQDQYKVYKSEGKPQEWCGGIFGAGVNHIDAAEMEQIIKLPTNGKKYYTRVWWKETYAESAGHFYNVVLPALIELGNPENTRIVFGFDS